ARTARARPRRRRANVLLDLLNAAYERDPRAMASALAADEVETEEALVYLLVLGETLRGLQVNDLSREAVRYNLATAYEKLVEGVYGRLVNVPLAAKSILARRPKSYREIAELALGAKQNEIDQATDPRFAAAFVGVSTVARNAGAHCTVDTAGDKIRLTERDKKGRVEVEELTDDEFTARLQDLLLTCHALRLSAELLRIEHHHELPPPGPASRPRVIAEAARVLVGYFGLVRADIRFEGQERVVVDAEEDERTPGRAPRDYLAAAFTLATLFPNHVAAELRVARDGSRKCRVEVSIADVLEHRALPDDVELYSLLKLCYVSTVEPRELGARERYVQELIQPGARLLAQDLAALQQLRAELPRTKQDYAATLSVLIQKVEHFADVLQTATPPNAAVAPRDSLLAGLTALERGLREHQRLMRSGQWAAVGRRSERLERGARIAVRWAT
ncbi:MAG: hypothetical protein M3Q10_19675, partial [Chloroflexota bacterium]|nr:hypothetical protein [Chloroflexota bacterium]